MMRVTEGGGGEGKVLHKGELWKSVSGLLEEGDDERIMRWRRSVEGSN